MANELSKAIKHKVDSQTRMREMDRTPSIFEGASGQVVYNDPTAYQVVYSAGRNVEIGTSGNMKVINAVMNLLAGDNVTITEPDEDGQVTISVTITDDTIGGKVVAVDDYAGKGGFVLSYDETVDQFILADLSVEEPLNVIPAGGTAGQILVKLGEEDYNVGWVDPPTVP